jgi:hypothetical protein
VGFDSNGDRYPDPYLLTIDLSAEKVRLKNDHHIICDSCWLVTTYVLKEEIIVMIGSIQTCPQSHFLPAREPGIEKENGVGMFQSFD